MERLVGQHREVANAFQMADRRVNVDRLYWIAAGHLQDVVRLSELEEVAVVLLIARAAAAIGVGAVWRRAHLGENDVVAAKSQIVRRIARVNGELGGCMGDQFEDHVRVEADAQLAFPHIRAMRLHDDARLVMENVHADLPQEPEAMPDGSTPVRPPRRNWSAGCDACIAGTPAARTRQRRWRAFPRARRGGRDPQRVRRSPKLPTSKLPHRRQMATSEQWTRRSRFFSGPATFRTKEATSAIRRGFDEAA